MAAAYKRDKRKKVSFRPWASIPYDARLLHYRGLDRVSLSTLDGRVVVPMVMGAYQAEQFGHVKLYAELVRRRDGKWFLMATVEFDDVPPVEPNDFLGVDLGVGEFGHRLGWGMPFGKRRRARPRKVSDTQAAASVGG